MLRAPAGTAAGTAGLRGATVEPDGRVTPGDVIVTVNGQPVESVPRLLSRLDDFRVGGTVRLTVVRENRRVEVPVTLQSSQ